MSNALSTAGVKVFAGVETTAGTRPTALSAYTEIADVKEVPELNPEPSTLDSTTLAETEYKTYIAGLKDLGGAISFTANFTNELKTTWDKVVDEYKTASSASKAMWFCIVHPDLTKAVYFKGSPSAMGLPAMSVDSILETNLYIVPSSAPQWEAKPTSTSS